MLVNLLKTISTIALAPIILVFLASLSRRKTLSSLNEDPAGERIALLVPLREEAYESIEATLASIEKTNYPKDLIDVYLIVKNSDSETIAAAEKAVEKKWGFKTILYKSPLDKKLKAVDLNAALANLPEILGEHEIVGVLDADLWYIDPGQPSTAVLMLKEQCAAVSPKIYAFSETLLGHLTLAESITWYDGVFKGLEALGATPPLTGKSIYVSSRLLRETGGFPEELAEDASLTLQLAVKGVKTCYIDSYTFTLPPKDLGSFIKQRRRWSRAIATLAARALASPAPAGRRLGVIAPYLLSLDLVVFMSTSTLHSILAGDSLGFAAFAAVSLIVFSRIEEFSRRFPVTRRSLVNRVLSSILFTPFIMMQVLIQLAALFVKEDSWVKTRRR